MKKILFLLVLVSLLAAPALAEMKLGVVDFDRVLEESEVGKATKAKIQNDREIIVKKMQKLEEEFKALSNEFEKQKDVMKPGALADKRTELEKKYFELQQSEQKFQLELQRNIQAQTVPLEKSFVEITEALAKKEGYALVFDRRSTIYITDTADLTDKVIAEANKSLKK